MSTNLQKCIEKIKEKLPREMERIWIKNPLIKIQLGQFKIGYVNGFNYCLSQINDILDSIQDK